MTDSKPHTTSSEADHVLVSSSLFDFLLIELVPLSHRLAQTLHARNLPTHGLTPASASKPASSTLDESELRDASFYRLESLGYRVGLGIAESLSAAHPMLATAVPRKAESGGAGAGAAGKEGVNPASALDTMKFLCKDVWTAVFRKQIDNLKTNHRGTFVLTDNRFEPLRRCSLPVGGVGGAGGGGMEEAGRRAQPFLFFPTGLIRGVLNALGVEASVSAEVAGVGLPGVVFTIRSVGAR